MKQLISLALALSVAAGACGAPLPQIAPTVAPARKSGVIRLYDLVNVDVRDVPMLMAIDDLRAQGYTVEVTLLASGALIAEGLNRGEADLALINNQTMWTAVKKGAPVRTLLQAVDNTTVLIVKQGTTSCSALDGKPVGLPTLTGLNPSLLNLYLKANCPGAAPKFVAIPESAGRTAALLSGQLEATTVPGEEFLKLEKEAPGKFAMLLVFAQAFPQLRVEGLHARKDWLDKNPQVARDFARALLEANRKVTASPHVLYDEAVKRLTIDAATAKQIADTHLRLKVWDPNGALTQQNVESTIAFLADINAVPKDTAFAEVADLSVLEDVLKAIGRK